MSNFIAARNVCNRRTNAYRYDLFFAFALIKRQSKIELYTIASTSFFIVIFNYVFIFGQGGTGEEGNIEKNFGANFTLFNVAFPILMVASGCFLELIPASYIDWCY